LAAVVGKDRGSAALVGRQRRRKGAPAEAPWHLGLAGPDLGPSGLNLSRVGSGQTHVCGRLCALFFPVVDGGWSCGDVDRHVMVAVRTTPSPELDVVWIGTTNLLMDGGWRSWPCRVSGAPSTPESPSPGHGVAGVPDLG
jgi:hypothetical protein